MSGATAGAGTGPGAWVAVLLRVVADGERSLRAGMSTRDPMAVAVDLGGVLELAQALTGIDEVGCTDAADEHAHSLDQYGDDPVGRRVVALLRTLAAGPPAPPAGTGPVAWVNLLTRAEDGR